jgi:transcriptional regulator with XRE-family HTH domain
MSDVMVVPTTATEIVGSWIRENRQRLGLTQKQLGMQVGLDQSEMSQVETGTRRVQAGELARIIITVGATPDWEAVAKGLYLPDSLVDLSDLA